MSQIYGIQQLIEKSHIPADLSLVHDHAYHAYRLALTADSYSDIATALERLSILFEKMAREVRNKDKT